MENDGGRVWRRLPRMRGDDPVGICRALYLVEFAPHARG